MRSRAFTRSHRPVRRVYAEDRVLHHHHPQLMAQRYNKRAAQTHNRYRNAKVQQTASLVKQTRGATFAETDAKAQSATKEEAKTQTAAQTKAEVQAEDTSLWTAENNAEDVKAEQELAQLKAKDQ